MPVAKKTKIEVAAPAAKTKPASPQGSPQYMDIAKPGTLAPAGSSAKPIIVSNRSLIKDPMVVTQPAAEAVAASPDSQAKESGSKIIPSKSKIVLQPLSAPEISAAAEVAAKPAKKLKIVTVTPDSDGDGVVEMAEKDNAPLAEATDSTAPTAPDTASAKPVAAGGKLTGIKAKSATKTAAADTSAVPTESSESPATDTAPPLNVPVESNTADATSEVAASDIAAAPDTKVADPTKAGAGAAENGTPTTGPAAATENTAPAAPETPAPDAAATPDAAGQKAENQADSTPSGQAAGSSEIAEQAASVPDKDKEEAKLQAEIKASEELNKLTEEKTYFLPITSAEKRRSRHVFMWGTLVILVLAAAWVNVALDAGLIEIPGVEPLTHFFSAK